MQYSSDVDREARDPQRRRRLGALSTLLEEAQYRVLRTMAHRRAIATEEELNAAADRVTVAEFEKGIQKCHKVIERFEGHIPVDPALSYLDMGCGPGELTIALAQLGLRDITGVDFLPRFVKRAQAYAAAHGVSEHVRFICQDLHAWVQPRRYDVLFSFDVFEHIDNPQAFLRRMHDFIAPGGSAVLAFGPLFHSPFGDHCGEYYRFPMPWRGVLFSEGAMMRVRKECYRPTDPARHFGEIAGGLNLMRYSEFLKHVRDTGWRFGYLSVNTFLHRSPALKALSDAVMRVPHVQDYFAHNVYCVLKQA
jgi:2-polyprenyl-3-methyl-5-hydroxy-6-metoxy-1,4-benzoquinol methylase